MRDYINEYGTKKVQKFQEGGMAGDPNAAAGGGDAQGQIEQALAQFAETQDPELAVQICNMLIEMMGGAGAQQEPPAGDMGAGAGGTPMARRGMKTKPIFPTSLKN